jgi:hypothetical protein
MSNLSNLLAAALIQRFLLAALVVGSALMGACSDVGTGPTVNLDALAFPSVQNEDVVYWVDNVLEVEDNGSVFRFVRDQGQATWMELYQDNVHIGSLTLSGQVVRYALEGVWMDLDASTGEILDTSQGTDPCYCPGAEPCMPCEGLLSSSCHSEFDTMQEAAWNAAAVGGLAVATTAHNVALGAGFVVAFAYSTGWAIGKAILWGACKVGLSSSGVFDVSQPFAIAAPLPVLQLDFAETLRVSAGTCPELTAPAL